MRPVLGALHRWLGLATAAFLAFAGLTGSVIAFIHELDEGLNPELFTTTSTGTFLSPTALAQRVDQEDSRAQVVFMGLERQPGHAVVLIVQPRQDDATARPFEIGYNQIFADPVTGAVLGKRDWGAIKFDRAHIIPLIYTLHFSLLLPGKWGTFLMGGVAIAWTLDGFIALALTFPRGRPFFAKWKLAWAVRTQADPHRRNLDLHRAGGLCFWLVLLVVAISGVSLALHEQVFRPVVSIFSTLSPSIREVATQRPQQNPAPALLDFDQAVARGEMAAKTLGLTDPTISIFYAPRFAAYGVSIGEDHGAGFGPSWLYLDDQTGALLLVDLRGSGSAGDLFVQLQFPLHSGQVAGLPGRIAVAMIGLLVAGLSVTGVMIWWRKRRARSIANARRHIAVEKIPAE